MQQENNNTDNILRKLENDAHPDLSQMDAHWEGMQKLLAPVPQKEKNTKLFNKNISGLFLLGMTIAFSSILLHKYAVRTTPASSLTNKEIKKDSLSPTSGYPVTDEILMISPESTKDTISHTSYVIVPGPNPSSGNLQDRKSGAIVDKTKPTKIKQEFINDTIRNAGFSGTGINQFWHSEEYKNTIVTFREIKPSNRTVDAIIVTGTSDTLKLTFSIPMKDSIITKEILDSIRTKLDSIKAITAGI